MNSELKNWLEFIQSSGVPLRKFDDNDVVRSLGTGCLVDIRDRRFLFTVFHVPKQSSEWVIQIKYNEIVDKIEVYHAGTFNYLADFEKNEKKIREVEFAFVEVPNDLVCIFQHRNYLGQCLVERPRTIFKETDVIDPSLTEVYGFAGEVKAYLMDSGKTLSTEHQTYPGLKYDRTEGDYHCFKLPVDHPGHKSFEGCSGSPIIDSNRKLVGLVNHGCIERNEVYGVNLAKCVRTINQSIGVLF